jgi:hypothetical protein
MTQSYKYKAFISYSHSDEKWATWLHKALETYKVPANIIGRETRMGKIPPRLHPIFRDRDELPSATNLGELLTQSLADSATQIVICSPASAQSRWVNEEILTFKRLGRSDRIFCLIIDGEPGATDKPGQEEQECFPPALRYEIGDDGELSDVLAEPIAADARLEGDGKVNAARRRLRRAKAARTESSPAAHAGDYDCGIRRHGDYFGTCDNSVSRT